MVAGWGMTGEGLGESVRRLEESERRLEESERRLEESERRLDGSGRRCLEPLVEGLRRRVGDEESTVGEALPLDEAGAARWVRGEEGPEASGREDLEDLMTWVLLGSAAGGGWTTGLGGGAAEDGPVSVSYTHLTLPTICSV